MDDLNDIQKVTQALYDRNHELAIITKNLQLLRDLYHIGIITLEQGALIEKLASAIQQSLELDEVIISPIEGSCEIPPDSKYSRVFDLTSREQKIGCMVIKLKRPYDELSAHEHALLESTVGVISIALDRARTRKALQEANEKLIVADRMKSQFLSFASHQVKSPMTVVKGYAELIQDGSYGEVPEKVKETTQKIRDAADQLIALVNNLLDLRKLEEGKIEYNFADGDINDLVKTIYDGMKTVADAKGLTMTLEAPAQPIMLHMDTEKIRQVIQNLIDNSLKYTQSGWVRVQVKVENSKITISVADSGLGIPADIIDKLFEQFNRGTNEAKKIQGTGLGLYIAKQFVLAHNGRIWAESQGAGKGSAFIVELPL